MRVIKESYFALRAFFLRLLVPRLPLALDPARVRSIVVVRDDRIGDFVVSLPAIRALKELFPSARISVVLNRQQLPLAPAFPYIDEAIGYAGFFATIRTLRKKKFDLAFDFLLDHRLRTALVCRLSARCGCGFDVRGRGRIFTIAVTPSTGHKRMGLHLLDLVNGVAARLGLPPMRYEEPRLFLHKDEKDYCGGFLAAAGIKPGERIVGIHPGGYYPSQRWPERNFAALIDGIAGLRQVRVFLFGARNDTWLLEKIKTACATRVVCCHGLDTLRLAAMIESLSLLVCNNSGPLHLAAALGVPTVSTMGPTDPWLWQPSGSRAIVLRKELRCSPCGKARCGSHACLAGITVEEMVAAAVKQLDGFSS